MTERNGARDPGRRRVVIVGGGFGGLTAARRLAAAPVDVALVDRHNYHLFQPLLYQVATAALSPADVAQPIRKILSRQTNCQVYLNTVETIDLQRRVVGYGGGEAAYDYLVLAAGATHSYFGHPDWAADAPGLKTIDDALEIRRRMLLAFEEAELELDGAAREAKLTFVVVGGGPTGVELAGALKEIAARTIPRDFRNIDIDDRTHHPARGEPIASCRRCRRRRHGRRSVASSGSAWRCAWGTT